MVQSPAEGRQPTGATVDTLRLYVVWHPEFAHGLALARAVHRHFDSLGMVRDGVRLSVPVRTRTAPASGTPGKAPRRIDLSLAEHNFIIVLAEPRLARASGRTWRAWFDELEAAAQATPGTRVVVVPVGRAKGFSHFAGQNFESTLEHHGPHASAAHIDRLLIRLSHDIAKDLWRPGPGWATERLTVFLSHARGDEDVGGGAVVARQIADFLKDREYGLEGFLDVRDTQNGVDYGGVFEDQIRNGAVLAIYSPRYGTRPFCRKELMWAKQHRSPLLVALRMDSGEERTFPYKGNAPLRIIRKSTAKQPIFARLRQRNEAGPGARIEEETIRLLIKDLVSEVLRCLVWRATAQRACRMQEINDAIVLPRPVELADIAYLMMENPERTEGTIVYPDPPLDDTEQMLIAAVAGNFRLMTLTQLEAGR
jgi:hypothetical protein